MSQHSNPDSPGGGDSFRRHSRRAVEWSLRPAWRAVLFIVPLAALCAVLIWSGIRIAWLSIQIDSFSTSDVEKAIRLDPENPDLRHRLGVLDSMDPTEANLNQAIKNLQAAADMNPRRWDFWSDLGTACDFAGNTNCSDAAFERAWVRNPMTPSLQWVVGNHYFLTNQPQKAFPFFRRLLKLDPSYMDNTFRLCLRATQDPQVIYSQVIPPGADASARFAFLMFLCSGADYENAMKIWGEMIAGPDRSPSLTAVKPFLDFLLDHNQIDDAGTVWNNLANAGVISLRPGSPDSNLIYNGGFEQPLLNTGFDWRMSDSPDLLINFSAPSAYQGSRCLQVDFPVGRNREYTLVDQIVRIRPNTSYQLTAYVRSRNLTSNSGPRLRVTEIGCDGCEARSSDPTVGTADWHRIDVEFVTHPQTQAVQVSFYRPFDKVASQDITGMVWLDNVILRPVDVARPPTNSEKTR